VDKFNSTNSAPKYILIKLLKAKQTGKILKVSREEKQISYKVPHFA
jgi:hypothetical protein